MLLTSDTVKCAFMTLIRFTTTTVLFIIIRMLMSNTVNNIIKNRSKVIIHPNINSGNGKQVLISMITEQQIVYIKDYVISFLFSPVVEVIS